ncbi:MAG: hypothetical protein K2P99_01210 [Burkholderiales bacterium]|nr:hypothetical protein [Burkholderiales bacterium]
MNYRSRKFRGLDIIYNNAINLSSVKNTCEYLDQLNQILHQSIPEHYKELCHFGAVDTDNNIAILFISQPQVFHILRTMSEHILRRLNQHNFNFEGILFKVKNYRNKVDIKPKYKVLPTLTKNKLTALANIIGMPELVHDDIVEPDKYDENEINI